MSSPASAYQVPTSRNPKRLSLAIPPSPRSSLSLAIPDSPCSVHSSPPSPSYAPRTTYAGFHGSPATALSTPETPLIIRTPASASSSASSDQSYSGVAPSIGLGRPVYSAKTSRRPSLLSLISLPPTSGYAAPEGSSPPTLSMSTSPSARARAVPSAATRLVSYNEEHVQGDASQPYADGPVQVVPGVWIGAEESVFQYDIWAGPSSRARVVNVAKEVPNPFDGERTQDGLDIDYLHLKWGHGQGDLANVPAQGQLGAKQSVGEVREDAGFWDAIQWMEAGRERAEPVLIHCQCGVSRSASLTIAYIMYLACLGALPDQLGHLDDMQSCYNFVKSKSGWIGPNVSLVYQLLEFSRNLCKLLPPSPVNTSFKPLLDPVASEDEWVRRRREMEQCEADAEEESARLDREMEERRRHRER